MLYFYLFPERAARAAPRVVAGRAVLLLIILRCRPALISLLLFPEVGAPSRQLETCSDWCSWSVLLNFVLYLMAVRSIAIDARLDADRQTAIIHEVVSSLGFVVLYGFSTFKSMALRSAEPLAVNRSAGILCYFVPLSHRRLRFCAIALWDIDVIIRKTLVYSVLTALLALIYFGGVVLVQQLTRSITASSDLAIAVSTLIIAALFFPLRRRVQNAIDRRFYRRKYNAQQVLARFAQTARDEVELDKLTAGLIDVVNETMQPANVTLWLRDFNSKG